MHAVQFESRLRSVSGTFFDVMGFVKLRMFDLRTSKINHIAPTHHNATPSNLMHRRLFYDNLSLPFESTLLLAETACEDGICSQDLT